MNYKDKTIFCKIQNILILTVISFLFVGCSTKITGLHPEYPPIEKRTFSLFGDFTEIDSLQPTIKWESFPNKKESFAQKVQDVTYELRIWSAEPEASGKLVYLRKDLQTPHHRLEQSLRPSTRYYWSVRARFFIHGKVHVTEWGMAGVPLRNETVPNYSSFRFQTPTN